jgi:hypothetical protein
MVSNSWVIGLNPEKVLKKKKSLGKIKERIKRLTPPPFF